MAPDSVERKLAAILSADVVGYSRLMADDEAETIKTLKAHKDLMGGLIRQHAGRVVDAVGDDLLADFPSVVDAVACAVAIQSELAKRNEELAPNRRMLFRIGVNLGDVIVEEDRIYGDGVNIAARVQGLAEEGGVSISGTAFDHVEGKLGLESEDLGERHVKNIPRPVRVYRVQVTEAHREVVAQTAPGFAGRPAIAVLPFDNLSGDPEQEYFADGIAEDLLTRLSAWRFFPVIARNSSFVYKGTAVDVKRVSRELGVRYVVEGSVRKAGERVRISAQLIDATTGHHVWAERYDRDLRDIFSLQDEISETIAGRIGPELFRSEQDRATRMDAQGMEAWDLAQRGLWHLWRFTKDDTTRALAFFGKAIERDDRCALAFLGLSMAHRHRLMFGWAEPGSHSASESLAAAERAVACDDNSAGPVARLGAERMLSGDIPRAILELERAVELNPSHAPACAILGAAYGLFGRVDEGFDLVSRAIRLSPNDPESFQFLYISGLLHYAQGRYDGAVDDALRSVENRRDYLPAWVVLVASYSQLGRPDEAQSALQHMQEIWPKLSLEVAKNAMAPVGPRAEELTEALRKAGLKE